MATVYSAQGGGKALDVEFGKITVAGTSSTETISTRLKRILFAQFTPFGGTHSIGYQGTYMAAHALSIQGTVDGTATDGGFGFLAGTAESNTVTVQRGGTAAGPIVYMYQFHGNR